MNAGQVEADRLLTAAGVATEDLDQAREYAQEIYEAWGAEYVAGGVPRLEAFGVETARAATAAAAEHYPRLAQARLPGGLVDVARRQAGLAGPVARAATPGLTVEQKAVVDRILR